MTEINPTTNTVNSVATVATEHASRYLQQLCKHFQHKLPVTFDETKGQVDFTIGSCRLDAKEGVLTMSLNAPDEVQMAQLQDVVVRHLVRFAFREELPIEWSAPQPSDSAN
jgi:hypothetical protein